VSWEDDHGAWLGPLFTVWLPLLLILGIAFLFLTRMRDPRTMISSEFHSPTGFRNPRLAAITPYTEPWYW